MKTKELQLSKIAVLRAGGVTAGVYCVILILVFPLALGLAALVDGITAKFIGYYIGYTIGHVIVGFLFSCLGAFAYNLVAKYLGGGLILHTIEEQQPVPSPVYNLDTINS